VARLAIAKSFLAKYASLDEGVRSAIDVAIARFAEHPDPGECLETPQHALDARIRTLGVDGGWSGVVLAPASGDLYCLVTVLPKAMALAYAASRRFSVNEALGVLEVRDEEAIGRLQPAPQAAAEPAGRCLFADVSDAELTRLGVDGQILQKIRLLASEKDLEGLEAALPEAQYAALYALACGMTVDEAWEEVTRLHSPGPLPDRVDTDDLASAMERSPGQVTFVSGPQELQLILSHPFAQWRTFLHPSQHKIAYRASYSGPAQVTGGPGTGKTVTVLHRAAFLAARAADQVLVTSFNGILADALAAQLDLLIPDEGVRRRIQVLNVDRLAYAIVKAARGTPVIVDERMLRGLWADAAADAGLGFTPAFMKNEWEHVILAQDLSSEQAYLSCLRAGRGRPLGKAQRSQVWQAAQRVTGELSAARQSTHLQLANEATHLLRQAEAPRYGHILVDDAQDLHPSQWRLLRAAVAPGPDDLFVAADPHQRIYNSRVSLTSLAISVRGRSHRLSLNYRTTQEILAWAVPLLGGESVTGLDGEADSLTGYRSPMHGAPPQLRGAATRAEEFGWLAERIRSWLADGIEPQAIGLTARSGDLVREAREVLKADGIATTPLSGRRDGQGVRAGTMHAMKGLEFQAVAVIGVEQGLVPEPEAVTAEDEDPIAYAQDLLRERCTLFVACTRARDHLYVSGTGEPSPFLHPREAEPSAQEEEPPTAEQEPAAAAEPTAQEEPAAHEEPAACDEPAVTEEPAATEQPAPAEEPAVRPKVTRLELLQLREDYWGPRLRGVSLVAEADLRPQHTRQVAAAFGRLYGNLRDARIDGEAFLLRWPAALAAAMAGVAVTDYQGGSFWPALWAATGIQGTAHDQGIWGRAFNAAVARLGLPTFRELPLPYLGPILMHAGIPAYCLGDYFKLLLSRRRHDPGTDAENFLAWATAPGRESRLGQLDKPAQRFLLNGGDYAHDIVDRTLDLLDRLTEPDPDFDAVRLPSYMIEAAKRQHAAGLLDLTGTGKRRTGTTGTTASKRQMQPRIALDPYGQGVHVLLPAVGDTPDGVARWRVTADGETRTVQSRAAWVGAAETTPQTAYPLDRPVRAVVVSLANREDLATELRVVDQADPVLFFHEDGRRLAATVSLPRSQIWIMHPAEQELEFTGSAGQVVEPAVPFGWDGWRLRLVSLENVQAVGLAGGRSHPVEVHARPRLLLDDPLPGVATPFDSPVYTAPPRLFLPHDPGAAVQWYAEVRRAGDDAPLVSRVVDPAEQADLWAGVPRPVLGAFEVTVRGPLGRGLRRTIFIAEGMSVAFQPQVRLLTGDGLAGGTARLTAIAGAAVQPEVLRFGPAERAQLVEYRAGSESEPLVITPPHVSILCPRAGVTTWTTSPVHLVTEDFADAGRLMIRIPAAGQAGRPRVPGQPDRLELAVLLRGRQVQAIESSGQRSPGLAGFELARAADTVAAHRHAQLALDMGSGAPMPVGYVRPRRLASGVDLSAGKLVLRDAVVVDGLTAGVYLAYAPWRPPAELAVAADGTAELPDELRDAGPFRVLLRIDDPWVVSDWPAWPRSGAYACPAAGVPASGDYEEASLSRFVAGEAGLPPLTDHLGWLWRLVDLAADLVDAGARTDLAEQVIGELLGQPRTALLALAGEELGQADVVRLLIATGIAAAPAESREWTPEEQRVLERLWAVLPAAAAAAGNLSGEDDVADAATAQCGDAFAAILDGHRDPHESVGRFGPNEERVATWLPGQVDALWQAALVVPKAMLDADTRLAAARRMFDARNEQPMRAAAGSAKTIAETAGLVVSRSRYPDLADAISARRPSKSNGWLYLPAMSIAMALLARLAARGNSNCAVLERDYRGKWANLALYAPDLVAIDIVLAEALVTGALPERPEVPGGLS
jgi:hypothetical protein